MIKAIIFDCFGVIITDALEAITKELTQSEPVKAQEIIDIVLASNHGMMDADEGRQQIANLLGIPLAEYRHKVAIGEVKDEWLISYIKELRKSYKTAMLSNVGSGGLKARFSERELAETFHIVVASSDIGFAKPEAQAYEYVADNLEVRLDECVFLDDREEYCEGARAVGMQSVLYQNFEQAKAELEKILGDSKS